MIEKKCSSCKLKKPLSSFRKRKGKRSDKLGYRYQCKECEKKYRLNPKYVYEEYKRTANKRGLEFDISFEDFLSFKNRNCSYCGEKLNKIRLDRIDNDIGYSIKNLESCCSSCNFMKHTSTKEQFLKQIDKIYRFMHKGES